MRIAAAEGGLSNNAVQPTFNSKQLQSEKGTLRREAGVKHLPDKHQHSNNQIVTTKEKYIAHLQATFARHHC